ncbi:cysteine desulfurase family protein [Blattabacterium cuenoti]|uniref:cysteine desulfurase family protein n=1 Tax=Blattabacterium cuenoti TaxID=1653831 RepID=UPI00163CEDA7|nr:cysteine desulfurase family protein [Blattabacterium cuenoti]
MKRAYLDNASTTPIRKEVLKVMIDILTHSFGNPSSVQHSYGREARSIIEESRIRIAKNINAYPSEIIFTSGGTEANNMILRTSVLYLGIKHILTSRLEHPSVFKTVLDLATYNKVTVNFIHINEKGIIDLNHMEEILKKNTYNKKLVSLMYANNEIGNLLEINQVIFLCKKYGAFFHSDTIQIIGNYPIDMKKLSIDFASASAHKFHGPKGIGFVFIRKNIQKKIKSIITGGNQEYGIRSGTENVCGIAGLSEALQLSCVNLLNHMNKIHNLKFYCISELKNLIPNIIFNGLSFDSNKSIPSILNFLYPIKKIDHLLYFHLDLMGVAVSKGNSCNSDAKKVSHVIQYITKESFLKKMMPIRVSFSIFNEKKDIDLFVRALQKIRNC